MRWGDGEVIRTCFRCVGRKDAIQPAFQSILGVVDDVFPVELRDVERAKDILTGAQRLSARDALHLAIMDRNRVLRILSFDSGFDEYPGIKRLSAI